MTAIVARCVVTGPGYLKCVAVGIVIFEAKRYALKLAAEKAFDAAVDLAIAKRDALIQVAIDGAIGIKNRAAECFQCCNVDSNCNSCKEELLGLSDLALFELGIGGATTIGDYCYIQDNSLNTDGACDWYAKGRRTSLGDGVAPPGTGCILGGRNEICWMDTTDILTQAEKESMCTPDYRANGGAQLRWAIENDYCMDEGVPLTC